MGGSYSYSYRHVGMGGSLEGGSLEGGGVSKWHLYYEQPVVMAINGNQWQSMAISGNQWHLYYEQPVVRDARDGGA